MKSYGQFCPVAQALEVVGERWTLLIVRELLSGSRRFTDIINGVPKIPRSVLAQRLAQIEEAGLVRRVEAKQGTEYRLTPAGDALEPIVLGLGTWARSYAHRDIHDAELDTTLLMWDIQRRIDSEQAPAGRVLIRFDFTDGKPGFQRYWLKIEDGLGDVCFKHPGFDEALIVRTNRRALVEIWMGYRNFSSAIRRGEVQIEGPLKLRRALPSWFRLNAFVELEAQRANAS